MAHRIYTILIKRRLFKCFFLCVRLITDNAKLMYVYKSRVAVVGIWKVLVQSGHNFHMSKQFLCSDLSQIMIWVGHYYKIGYSSTGNFIWFESYAPNVIWNNSLELAPSISNRPAINIRVMFARCNLFRYHYFCISICGGLVADKMRKGYIYIYNAKSFHQPFAQYVNVNQSPHSKLDASRPALNQLIHFLDISMQGKTNWSGFRYCNCDLLPITMITSFFCW